MIRNTIQRDMVFDAVKCLGNHASADEVYEYIVRDHPSIGRATVYRNLSALAKDGMILHIQVPNGADRYDHNTMDHYHVRCVKCDHVYDLEMEDLPEPMKYIRNSYGVKILDYELLFNGICCSCQQD